MQLFRRNLSLSKKIICYSLFAFAFTSCISTKDITYFQSTDTAVDSIVSKIDKKYTPLIQEGDILSIIVSSLDKKSDEMFNPVPQQLLNTAQATGTIAPQPIIGFQVDNSGYITLPLLGKLKVSGLSSLELSTSLREQLGKYLESPTVIVRIANFKISVLGEVARPAVYTISNEAITLPEALALAGDLTLYGKRKNVLIIRETNGSREFARVDLTSKKVFNSPYYYLHSGDIVYIEPSAGKVTSSDRLFQLTPIVISSLTLMVLVITTISNFTK